MPYGDSVTVDANLRPRLAWAEGETGEILADRRHRVTPATTLTPAATSGAGVNFTAGASTWINPDDVGSTIVNRAGAGAATITAVTNGTVAVATITQAFPNTNAIPAGSWRLRRLTPGKSLVVRVLAANGRYRHITLAADQVS